MEKINGYHLERLKDAFSAAPCGVGIFDAQSRQPLYFNGAYYALVGYTPEEYHARIGNAYRQLVLEEDRSIDVQSEKDFAAAGKVFAAKYRIVRGDGDIRWVRFNSTAALVDEISCALCFFEDITPEKDSFEQLRLVAESIGNSISVIRIKGEKRELLYANDTFFKWVGAEPGSYDSDTLEYNLSFVAKEDRSWMLAAVQKSVLTGEPQQIEYRFQRPGEPLRWMSRRLTAVKRDEPDAYLIVSIVTDITEKKELEEKLNFERERYQSVVDNMPSGFVKIRLNPDGSANPVFINQAFSDMTGMTAEECMALYREDSCAGVHPDDMARMQSIMKDFRVGVTTSYNLRLRKGKSGWMWVRISSSPREEDGQLMLYNNYLDISSERENSLMLDSLLNELPGGVAIFKISDADMECQYFNDGFAALSERSREDLDAMLHRAGFFEQVIYPQDRSSVLNEMKTRSASGEPINTTFRYLTRSGNTKWLHLNANQLREDGGCPVYYCIFTEPSRQAMLYQSIANEAGIGILVSDEKTHEIYYTNRAFRELMHITGDSYAGKACYEYVLNQAQPCENCAAAALSPGETHEVIRYFPEIEAYIKVRSVLVNWLGRTALAEYGTDVTADYRDQLRQQELLNSVPSGFGIFEIDHGAGRLIQMNDYYYRMVGESRESRAEKRGDDFLNVVPKDDRPAIEALMAKLAGGSDSGYVDHRVLCGDGLYRWFRLTAAVIKREGQKLTVYCSYADMDETIRTQKKLEQANRVIKKQYEAEQEQRRLIEKGSIVTIRFNMTQDKLIEYHSEHPAFMQYAAGAESGAILDDLRARIPLERERRQAEEFFDNASGIALFRRGVTERSVEYRSRQQDGRLHWLRATARFSRDAFTDDVISYTFIRDINFDKKKELVAESLIEEETDYVILLSAYENTCQLLRLKGDFEQPDDWHIGEETPFDSLSAPKRLEPILPEDRASVRRFFNRATLMEGLKTQPVLTVTFRQAIAGKSIRRKKVRAFYLDETHEDIIIARRDITDLYEEEQEQKRTLQKALDEAMAASRAKTTFLSNMSHEIRTPLNAIIGMTELAQGEADMPAVQESLTRIQSSSKYLLSILNDILDMSQIESGRFTLDCQWVSPIDVLNPCIEMIRPAAEAKHITFLTPALDRIGPFEYYVDVLKTQRMLMNLLNNACKFTGAGGKISLCFQNKSHDECSSVDLITVEDSGCGMSEEFLKRIFTPFAQEHNIYSDTAQGTGLGLSLARQTALAMGGDITVESKLGAGSKFTITFPYRYRFKEQAAQKTVPKPKADLKKLVGARILLCEDNRINTVIAQKLLEKAGCTVDCAENGRLGVERFSASAAGAYAAVLMDIRMPEMDGLAAASAIRALERPDAKTVPIIAMSANAFDEDVKKSLDAGMNAHLPKPVEPQKLYETLAAYL